MRSVSRQIASEIPFGIQGYKRALEQLGLDGDIEGPLCNRHPRLPEGVVPKTSRTLLDPPATEAASCQFVRAR
jgi:hypothetical protein